MSRQDVLNKAQSQDGTVEAPPNSNKTPYGLWYAPSLNGQKWCAMFVSWVFHHAGHPLGNIQTRNGIHHCQSAHNYYKAKEQLTTSPQPGDIVIYDWEGNGYADHIGIFIRWTNSAKTALEAWEGNTSLSNNSDGGRVMKRVRSRNLVKSFINPGVYENVVPEVPTALTIGSRGSDVTIIQNYLYELGYEIEVDGWFGQQTAGFVKDFQQQNAMAATGTVDEVTRGALQEAANDRKIAKSDFISGSLLRKGSKGFMVTEVQRKLNTKDSTLKLPISGIFEEATEKAVKAFQTKSGLKADGIIGPLTFAKLDLTP